MSRVGVLADGAQDQPGLGPAQEQADGEDEREREIDDRIMAEDEAQPGMGGIVGREERTRAA
jgi:hypothetical protein